jgi:hypothetical protein
MWLNLLAYRATVVRLLVPSAVLAPAFLVMLGFAGQLVGQETPAASSSEEIKNAVRAYAWLSSEQRRAAAKVIVGLPQRKRVQVLLEGLKDPQTPIDNEYLIDLAVWAAETSAELITGTRFIGNVACDGTPVDSKDDSGRSRYDQHLTTVINQLPRKTGDAFLLTYGFLLRYRKDLRSGSEMKEHLAKSLGSASPEIRLEFLRNESVPWEGLACESLTSMVRSFTSAPMRDPVYKGTYNSDRCQKADALRCYYRLAPEEARRIILAEMAKVVPDFDARGLLLLPDRELPDMTERFRAVLKEILKDKDPYWDSLPCVARYGTRDLLPEMTTLYEEMKGRWACVFQEAVLRFFVKHDRERGLAMAREAMTLRGKQYTGCYRTLFKEVLASEVGEDVSHFLLEYLDDQDERVAQMAGVTLVYQVSSREVLERLLRGRVRPAPEALETYIWGLWKAIRARETPVP